MHQKKSDPRPTRNKSWLLSNQARRAIATVLNPIRVAEEATRDISDNVRRTLIFTKSDSESENGEPHPNIDTKRDYTFGEIDTSLISALNNTVIEIKSKRPRPYISRTPSRVSDYSEFELTSYDSRIFDPKEMSERQNDKMSQRRKSETDAVLEDEISAEIENLRAQHTRDKAAKEPKPGTSKENDSITTVLHEMREQIATLFEYVHTQNFDLQEQMREFKRDANTLRHETAAEVSYGRTDADIRNRQSTIAQRYMTPKHAMGLIPTFDGTSRTNLKSFLSACTCAMKYVKPEFENELLDVIMSTKLQGKALINFEIKDIQTFDQLKRELENFYFPKKNPTSIQIEFNHLKQRSGESAVEYGARADTLAMQLYESLTEGPDKTPQDKRTILNTIKQLALQNFVYGLRDDIKMVIRAQRFETLQDAIEGAKAEEKLKRPREYANNASKPITNLKAILCHKCGKNGHYGRDCRTSLYANHYNLPRPSGSKLNALDK